MIICPNTSLLVIKILNMIKNNSHYFKAYDKWIIESHQSSKKSLPATAHDFADSLGLPLDQIVSLRDKNIQENILKIPKNYLAKHAYSLF